MTARVEFCGVPASGKSTLCAGALRLLNGRGRNVWSREDMVEAGLRERNFGALGNSMAAIVPGWRREFLGLPHSLNDWHRFVVDHPAFAAQIHQWLAEGESGETWRAAIFYGFLTSAFEFQLSQAARHPVLMDEGFAQRFFSLRGYRGLGRSGDAALYAATMPLPTALVWVSAPPEVCVERVEKRGERPLLMQDEPATRLPVRFAEGHVLLESFAAEAARRGVPVLRVDGVGDPGPACEKIAGFAEPFL